MAKVFGEIPGFPIGSTWSNRKELSESGVHAPPMSGISGTAKEGADSIVVNGGYEDDDDMGDEIIYTGAGGNDPQTKAQVADQSLDQPGNAGLVTSQLEGLPVRVIRGHKGKNKFSPANGLRYDGLFQVVDHWSQVGKSGFRIWRFKLQKIDSQGDGNLNGELPKGTFNPGKKSSIVVRTIRDNEVTRAVKLLYEHKCQFCGAQLAVPGGFIAQGAHVKGLGKPHYGPDTTSNMLCLCPNDHAVFDSGGLYVSEDLIVRDSSGNEFSKLHIHPSHDLDLEFFEYHRKLWGH
jgi:putative restriction endonuclease